MAWVKLQAKQVLSGCQQLLLSAADTKDVRDEGEL